MKRPTAADVEAMAKREARIPPSEPHIEVLLDNLDPEEDLRWCGAYLDLEKRLGRMAFLAVTDRRVILQKFARALKSTPDFYEVDLDDIVHARDEVKKVFLGLMSGHVLTIFGRHGTLRIQDLDNDAVAPAAQAIVTAKLDRLSEPE
jgi:hypothetical protein